MRSTGFSRARRMAGVVAAALGLLSPALVMVSASPPALAAVATPIPANAFHANAAGQDWANSYLLALLSRNTYLSSLDETVDPSAGSTTEANFAGRFAAWATSLGYTGPEYHTFTFDIPPIGRVSAFDTEYVKVETSDAIIFSFRGTETDVVTDWNNVMDILVDLAAGPWQGMHWGFAHAAAIAMPAIRNDIAAAPGKKIWLTGHSLGGAEAEIAAWLLQTGNADPMTGQVSTPIPVQGVVNFGAPRVFLESRLLGILPPAYGEDMVGPYNETFASRPTERWVDNADAVPLIPPGIPILLPYKHIGEVNNIDVVGTSCPITLNDEERDPFVDFGDAWDNFANAVWAWDWNAAGAALSEMGTAVLGIASIDDHDMSRYASRIYWHLPVDVKAQVPRPPYPAPDKRQTVCDTPDTTPPLITPEVTGTAGSNGWYRGDVTVSWDVSDPESEVFSSTGCGTTILASDTAGTTYTCTATSVGGTASQSTTVKRDVTPPNVTVSDVSVAATSTDGATVTWPADSATDATAGSLELGYSPPSGSHFPLGASTVTASATDPAGNTGSATFTVTVTYTWSGVLQPVNSNGTSIFKAGSTVPIKLALTGSSSAISDATVRLSFSKVSNGIEGSVVEAVSTAAATTGNLFRYDPTSRQYIFNWSTKVLSAGTYNLRIDLGGGLVSTVMVSLR